MIESGVTGILSAAHYGPEGELHGHTYEVTAWFTNEERRDVRCFKAAVDTVLSLWDHKVLPPEYQWAEDIARAVGTLANCVEVVVSRHGERLHARWRA